MPHDHKAGQANTDHHYQDCIDACFSCAEICNALQRRHDRNGRTWKKGCGDPDGAVHPALP